MVDAQSAVAAETPRPTLEELHAAMAAKRAEYDQLREVHAQLWQRRHAGTLEREGYIDFLWSEDRMALLLREIEQLTPAVLYGEAEDAILAGKQHYDAHIDAVTAAATQICEAWATFTQACAAFVQLADEQIGVGHMTVDPCGKQFLLTLPMAFKAKRNSAEAPRSSKKSCSGNMALCRV
jgi:predicted aminopeptidase